MGQYSEFKIGDEVRIWMAHRKICHDLVEASVDASRAYPAIVIGTSEHLIKGESIKHTILGWKTNPFPSGQMPDDMQIDTRVPINDTYDYRYKAFVPMNGYCEKWGAPLENITFNGVGWERLPKTDTEQKELERKVETAMQAKEIDDIVLAAQKVFNDAFMKQMTVLDKPAIQMTGDVISSLRHAKLGDIVRFQLKDKVVEGTLLADSDGIHNGDLCLVGFTSTEGLPQQADDCTVYTNGNPALRFQYYGNSIEDGKTYVASVAERLDTPCEIVPARRAPTYDDTTSLTQTLADAKLGDRVQIEVDGKRVDATVIAVKPKDGFTKDWVCLGFFDTRLADNGFATKTTTPWREEHYDEYVENRDQYPAFNSLSFETPCKILYSTTIDTTRLIDKLGKIAEILAKNSSIIAEGSKLADQVLQANSIYELPNLSTVPDQIIPNASIWTNEVLSGISPLWSGTTLQGINTTTQLPFVFTPPLQVNIDWQAAAQQMQTEAPKPEEPKVESIPESTEPREQTLAYATLGDRVIFIHHGSSVEGTVLGRAHGYTMIGYKADQHASWEGKEELPALRIDETPDFHTFYHGNIVSNLDDYERATSIPSDYTFEYAPEPIKENKSLSPLAVFGAALFAGLMSAATKPKEVVRVAEIEPAEEEVVVEEEKQVANAR